MDEIITLRSAQLTDCEDLAKLDNVASHGLSMWYWKKNGPASHVADAMDFGRQSMADTSTKFCYRNAVVAVNDGEIAGSAVGFSWNSSDIDIAKEADPVLKPIAELFALGVGGWLLDCLAVYRDHRNFGIGGKLLDDCFRRARKEDSRKMYLIADDTNENAIGLYKSRGFVECDRRKCVPFEAGVTTNFWLLMEATVQ